MWVLIIILISVGLVLMTVTYFSRKGKREEATVQVRENSECCGAHALCERENLLNMDKEIEYYDDEELDALSGKSPKQFSDKEIEQLSEVFYSLQESDVAGWLRSLQMRQIELPLFLREEALMIVGERRNAC